jgi:hypothetical protein
MEGSSPANEEANSRGLGSENSAVRGSPGEVFRVDRKSVV